MKKNDNIKISVFMFSLVIFLTTVFLYHLQVSADGEFINPVNFATGNDSLVSLDLNQDGKLDLISTDDGTRSGFSVLFGNGDGTFDGEIFYTTITDSDSLIGEDVNNDNIIDIVVSIYNYTPTLNRNLQVFIGNGDGTFTEGNIYNLTSKNVEDFTAGDFNEDLNIDIIINNNILFGNGDGTFDEAIIYTTINESGFYSVKTYDFNKDNHLDIALINNSSAKVFILLGNGDGTFDGALDYSVGTSPMNLALGDFNEDNNIDIAITNWSSVNISILLGNGDGTFGMAASYEILNGQPHDIYVNDLNKDGYLDLFISEGYSSVFAIFLGNGDGTFKIPEYYNTGSGASYNILAEDFNNDDSMDVSLLHYIESDYKVSIFLNKNNLNEEETITKISDNVIDISNFNLLNLKTISSNGNDIVFTSKNEDTNDYGIYLYNKNNDSIERISEIPEGGIGNEVLGAISNNGQYVVITSGGIDSEAESSISIYDHLSGTTKMITTNEQIPMLSILLMGGNLSVSNNGDVVISSNLNLSIMSLLMLTSEGELPPSPYLSAIYFYNNNSEEIITIDQLNDTNLTSPYSGIISDNGEEIIYNTIKYIPNIEPGADPEIESHYFLYSISSEEIEEININLGLEYKNIYLGPSISSNERYISFWASVFSEEAGLSTEESLLVFYDRQLNRLETYSLFDYLNNTPILESDIGIFSNSIDMSEDGKYIILSFNSIIKLFGGKDEQENVYPLFIYDRIKNESVILDDGNSYMSANLSADGKYITFSSPDTLTEDDEDELFDVFLMSNPLYEEPSEEGQPSPSSGRRTGSSRMFLARFQQEQTRRAIEAGIENYVSDYCTNVPALQSEVPEGWVVTNNYECYLGEIPPELIPAEIPEPISSNLPINLLPKEIIPIPAVEENPILAVKDEPQVVIDADLITPSIHTEKDNIFERFINLFKGLTGKIVINTIAGIGIISGVSLGIFNSLFINPISFSEIPLIPLRFWNFIILFFGFKKKTRPWGTVYDSVTKQPLDPVYVTILDLNDNEISSSITDLDGRYGFLVPPGQYKIKAGKANYEFPSKKLLGQTNDIIYQDLYFNEIIEVKEGEVITKNIPMDPLVFDWNEFTKKDKNLMKFFSKRDLWITRISNWLFTIGLIFSVIMFLSSKSTSNTIILIIYIILLVLKKYIFKPKPLGQILNKEGTPLAYAILRIFRKGGEGEVIHKVTNKIGKYYCLIPNGNYFAKIENKNIDESYSLVYTSEVFEVKRGYIRNTFKV